MKTEFYTALPRVLVIGLTAFALTFHVSATNILEQGLKPLFVVQGEEMPGSPIAQRMASLHVPGVSVAMVREGKLDWAKGYGIAHQDGAKPVDENTLFQAGSISKPVAAIAALQLVEQGKLELDTDVNRYLKSWKIPPSSFTEEQPITLRHLLTHTAGLTVWGFPGYEKGQALPSTKDVLDGKGNTDAVVSDKVPGKQWHYSGGGYTIVQLMVEDITGMTFADYARRHVLDPMGMTSSTYKHVLPPALEARTSAAFDGKGAMYDVIYHDYPEKAAAGLWTTPSDIARYVMHIQGILQGKTDGVLQKPMVEAMLTRHLNNWGLGPELSAPQDPFYFGHGGKNLGFTNVFRARVDKGMGIIIMTNGDNATPLNGEVMLTLSDLYGMGLVEQRVIAPYAVEKSDLKKHEGQYQAVTDSAFVATLTLTAGRLTVKVPDDDTPAELVPTAPLTFTSLETGSTFEFQQSDTGQTTGFIVNGRFELKKLAD